VMRRGRNQRRWSHETDQRSDIDRCFRR
jgi:hypothetical protein